MAPSLWFFGLLWIGLACTAAKNHHHQLRHFQPLEQEDTPSQIGDSEFVQHTKHVVPPYLLLPMFRHASAPFVAMEHFRPVAGRRVFPGTLTNILVPREHLQQVQVAPVHNEHGVEVWCGYRKVSVRINTAAIRIKGAGSDFYLGTCPVSRSSGDHLYFHYDLNACNSSLQTVGGKVVYSNSVEFRPAGQPEEEEEEEVIRVVPLSLPIRCLYDRFHYSYKVGYIPRSAPWMSKKTLSAKRRFTLSVCNENWELLTVNEGVVFGEPLYFQAAATVLAEDERVFISSCHVTATKDPNSTPRHDLISHSGCLMDSRRSGSLSRFFLRRSNFLRFSSDTFLFPQVASKRFYLHCSVLVTKNTASPASKSCTYNRPIRRWEELDGDDSVCTCCDSVCEADDSDSLTSAEQAVVTSHPWRFTPTERLPGKTSGRGGTGQGSVQVKVLQEHGEEEEVLLGEVQERWRTAVVEHENAVQQVLAGGAGHPLSLNPKERFPGATSRWRNTLQGNVQVKFLHGGAEDGALLSESQERVSTVAVEDKNAVQQELIWPKQSISTEEREVPEQEEEASQAHVWSEWVPVEDKREEEMSSSPAEENALDALMKPSQENWSDMNGKAGSVAEAEEPEGLQTGLSAEEAGESVLMNEETFLRPQHEPSEWSEGR